jgi:hypothetical protein
MIAGLGSQHKQLLMSDFVTWLNISGMHESNDLFLLDGIECITGTFLL